MNHSIVRIKSLNNQLGVIENLDKSSRAYDKETYKQQSIQKVRLLDSNFKLSDSYIFASKAELHKLDGKSIFSSL